LDSSLLALPPQCRSRNDNMKNQLPFYNIG
jgi:hypothetical protein